MLTGVGLSKVTGLLLMIPILIGVAFLQSETSPSETITIVMIVYMSVVWSLGKLIEQLYVSETYLWYKHFEDAQDKANKWNEEIPKSIHDIPRPSFADDKEDLQKGY